MTFKVDGRGACPGGRGPRAELETCPNCHSVFWGAYCSSCGQPKNVHRRRIGELLDDFFKDIFSFDSRILKTAWALMLRPGELTAAFRQGRTRSYVPAVRLYLFVSLFFFFALNALHISVVQFGVKVSPVPVTTDAHGVPYMHWDDGSVSRLSMLFAADKVHYVSTPQLYLFAPRGAVKSALPSAAQAQFRKMLTASGSHTDEAPKSTGLRMAMLAQNPAAFTPSLTELFTRILLVLLPMFALLLQLFYIRHRGSFLFVDHLVFSLNFHSFIFASAFVIACLKQTSLAGMAFWLLLPALAGHLLFAVRRVYGQGWVQSGIKASVLLIVYAALFAAVTLAAFGLEMYYD